MEILTLVLQGELEHQDSLGHKEVLRPGEVQVMSAGKGIRHSEYNPSRETPAHFLQIWIEPHTIGITPRYEQRAFPLAACDNSWCCLAGPAPRTDGSFEIVQNASVSYGIVRRGGSLTHVVNDSGAAWLHVIEGEVVVNGSNLKTGDAAAIEGASALECVSSVGESSLLLFAF
jgi:redox-sensitive bicupin YhaK (pirin superfamily)